MILTFFQEIGLFTLTQLIGVLVVLRGGSFIQNRNFGSELTIWEIILFFVFIAVFIYFIRKFSSRSAVFLKFVLGIAIFAGSQTVLLVFFKDIIISALLAIIISFLVLRTKIVLIHNIGIILALAGIGATLGVSLTPISVVFILLILSFYDIIAVYKTRHMIKMAQDMIKSQAIFGLVLPQEMKGWFENLEKVRPGEQFVILGSGDIVMPLVLISSVIPFHGLASGLIVLAFSLAGMFLTYVLFMNQKTRKPMAALPPIAVMSIIGYIVSIFV